MSILKIFNHESKTIGKGALVVAVFYVLNGLLALLRNALLSSKFGAGRELDIYYAAFRIPDFLYAILIAGAISAAFIPLFAQKLSVSKEKAWRFANEVLSVFAFVLGLGAILFAVFSPFLAKLIAPGFSPADQAKVAELTKIMMIQPVIFGVSNIIVGVLQSFKRFFITSLAPLFYNGGIIIGILFFAPLSGLEGLAWGIVLGAFLHFLIQLPSLKNLNFKFKFWLDFRSPDLFNILKLMSPRVLGLISIQINFLAITIIASSLASGSLAIFNFSNDLQNFPQNIFAVSFAISCFPVLASLFNDKPKLVEELKNTVKNILFFIIPLAVLFFILKSQIAGLTLEYGRFGSEQSILVAKCLGIFALSLAAQSLLPLLVRAFFALQNSWLPFVAGISSNIFNVILGLVLAKEFGILGLVWGFALASWLNLILLAVFLRRKIGFSFWQRNEWQSLGRILAASLFGGAFAWAGAYLFSLFWPNISGLISFLGQGAVGGILGLISYLLSLKLLKAPELGFLKSVFK